MIAEKKRSEFGKCLDIALAEKDVSYAELAKRMGVHQTAACRYRFTEKPRLRTVKQIAMALNIPTDRFLLS